MTEQEWLTATDPIHMLAFLHREIVTLVDELPSEAERQAMRRLLAGKTIPRKLVLFACACCRQIWQAVTDPRSRHAVEVAEQASDGLLSEKQLDIVALASHEARNAIQHEPGNDPTETHIRRVAATACWGAASAVSTPRIFRASLECAARDSADVAAWLGLSTDLVDARARQCHMLRCIFGNPFRLVTLEQSWRTRNTIGLAQTIDTDRAFDRLPVLGDALLDAGCTDPDILDHCRQQTEHARGCWVVDLVLEKG